MTINETLIDASATVIVDELRSQLKANGINLLGAVRDTPDNVMVSCPFHKNGQERKPSAGIKKSDGTFHCFACQAVHTLPEVISFCFDKDETGAFGFNWLLKNFASVDIENRKPLELNLTRAAGVEKPNYVSDQELDKYRYYHPYMWKRKLTPETVETFDIGYDSATQCLTFPVRDLTGGTLFVARRSVNTKFFNYPAHAVKPVYGLYELSQLPEYPSEVIICESMLDALAAWSFGKPAVALNGLGNDLQFKQLSDMPNRKFILATDNDEAGMQARERLRRKIKNHIITQYIIPKGYKDINDLDKETFYRLEEIF